LLALFCWRLARLGPVVDRGEPSDSRLVRYGCERNIAPGDLAAVAPPIMQLDGRFANTLWHFIGVRNLRPAGGVGGFVGWILRLGVGNAPCK